MFRSDNPTTINGRFTDGDPSQGVPPSIWPSESANAWQEELAYLVESAGITLSKADEHQVAAASRRLSQGSNFLIGATMYEEFQGYRGGTARAPGALLGPFFQYMAGSTVPSADLYAYDGAIEISAAVTAGQTIIIRARAQLSWALNPRNGIVSGNSYAFTSAKVTAQASARSAAGSVPFTMELSNLSASSPAPADILAEVKPAVAAGEIKTAVQVWAPPSSKGLGYFEIKITATGSGNLRAMLFGLGVRPGVVLEPLDFTAANQQSDQSFARQNFQVIKTRVRLTDGVVPSGGNRAVYYPSVQYIDRITGGVLASQVNLNLVAVYGKTPGGLWDYGTALSGWEIVTGSIANSNFGEISAEIPIQSPIGTTSGVFLAEIELTIRK
jgi:hypothetical protein